MAIKNSTKRIFLRKSTATFRVSFYADASNTIPLISLDASKYPAYTIFDINNVAVQSGIGQAEATPGTYKTEFLVPTEAPLSFDEKRWRIEWSMVSTDNRQVDFVEEFDVKDVAITQSDTREQKFITLCGSDTRMMVRLTSTPAELALDVFVGGSPTKVVDNVDLGSGVQKAVDGDSIVFYYDIPASALSANQYFSVIWKIRETPTDVQQFIYQSLTSISPNILNLIGSVRILIDKFQKRLGTVQAYEDSDIVEYLQRGQELVNAVYPSTFYSFGSLPSTLNVFHVLLASMYGLNAQLLLENDLGINFSGQTVTLEYDHTSTISDVIGKWQDFINTNLPPAKMALVRMTRPVGTVAGRGYRYNSLNAYTYKISHVGNGGNIIDMMTTLGILF